MRLCVRSKFDAAHRLDGHPGKCANLHGHTYVVEVAVAVPDEKAFGSAGNMAVDFTDLKAILQAHLATVDHICWLSEKSFDCLFVNALEAKLEPPIIVKVENVGPVMVTVGEPTAEKMAQMLYDWLAPDYKALGTLAGGEVTLVSVTVWETEHQGVTYAPGV